MPSSTLTSHGCEGTLLQPKVGVVCGWWCLVVGNREVRPVGCEGRKTYKREEFSEAEVTGLCSESRRKTTEHTQHTEKVIHGDRHPQ